MDRKMTLSQLKFCSALGSNKGGQVAVGIDLAIRWSKQKVNGRLREGKEIQMGWRIKKGTH